LNGKKDIGLNFGAGPDDTYFQYTTVRLSTVSLTLPKSRITNGVGLKTGWMMWPYMLAALSCGTRIVTYDGTPFYPDARIFLKFVGQQGYVDVSYFYIRSHCAVSVAYQSLGLALGS
jgi:acetoacetyl-CoA synthetase